MRTCALISFGLPVRRGFARPGSQSWPRGISPKHRLRDLLSRRLRFRICLHLERARVDSFQRPEAFSKFACPSAASKRASSTCTAAAMRCRSRAAKPCSTSSSICSVYTHPATSESASGRSILVNSLRAAESRCDMRTGSPASAARNAAPMAMFWILPPAALKRRQAVDAQPFGRRLAGKCPRPDLRPLRGLGERKFNHKANAAQKRGVEGVATIGGQDGKAAISLHALQAGN